MNTSKLATLANLPVSADELKKLDKELSETVSYVDHLSEIDTNNVVPTSQVTGKVNELREDKITPGLSQTEALQNAVKTKNAYFVVSKIIWE